MTDAVQIYGLYDPGDGTLRYIGKANNAAKRLAGHMRDRSRRDTPVYRWMNELALTDQCPGMVVLLECSAADWESVERAEIAKARASGISLLNVAAGGNEPYCSSEVRAANGRANARRRIETPLKARITYIKRAIGQGLKDGIVTDTTKEKLRLAARKAPHLFGQWAAL